MTTTKQNPTVSDLRAAAARAQTAYQWEDAVDHFSRALDLPDLSPTEEYELLNGRAFCYQRLGKFQAEVDDLVAMADSAQTRGDEQQYLDASSRQSFTLTHLGKLEQSQEMSLEVKRRAKKLGDDFFVGKALQALGDAYINVGEFERAAQELNEAIKIFQDLGVLHEEARCAYHLAYAGSYMGKPSEGHAQRLKEIAEQLDDRLLLGMANHMLGIIYQEQPLTSLDYQERALEIYESIGEVRSVGSLTHNLGVFYQEFGLYHRSIHLLNRAVEIFRETQGQTTYLLSLHMAGLVDFYLGRTAYAEERNLQAISESHEAGIKGVEAFALVARGLIQWDRGELEEALETLRKSAEMIEEIPAYIPFVLGLLGGLYLDLGDSKTANQTTEKAMELVGELHKPFNIEFALWSRYLALSQAASSPAEIDAAWDVLLQGRDARMNRIADVTDQGLRRAFLSRPKVNQNIILEWARQAHSRGESLALLLKAQSGERAIQQQFKRLLDTGARLAAQSDPASMLSFIIEEFVDLSGAEQVVLVLQDDDSDTFSQVARSYGIDEGKQDQILEIASPFIDQATLSRQAVLAQGVGNVQEGEPAEIQLRSMVVVPLVSHANVLGVLYADVREIFGPFNRQDVDLLTLLANQAAAALENAQLIEGLVCTVSDRTAELQVANASLEERIAELAVIHSVQEGLASKLDIGAIFELVGERISEIFGGKGAALYTYDAETDMSEPMYILEKGVRHYPPPFKPGPIGKRIIETKKPVMLSTTAEFNELGAITVEGTESSLSGIFTPLVVNDRVIGAMNIESIERENDFTESDLRLLTTLANSTSVALENARLFDETQRLLKETEDRNAELAVINSVQEGLAAQLDIQTIYELVGEKIREIFDAHTVFIVAYDQETKLRHFPYLNEQGKRIYPEPRSLYGFSGQVIETGEPLLITKDMEKFEIETGSQPLGDELPKRSWLGVPIMRGKLVNGVIVLEDVHDEAFGQSDLRLLTTLANSMSVALENARLFAETQRLLRETEDRNAELAIINAVQRALSAELDIRKIYQAVGEKLREIFDSQVVAVYSADNKDRTLTLEYGHEKDQVFEPVTVPFNSLYEYILELDDTFVRNEDYAEFASQFEDYQVPAGEMPKSVITVPVRRTKDAEFVVSLSLQDVDGEKEFTNEDVRLLETLATSMGIALENARLLEETQRLLNETEERNAELIIINSVQEALAAQIDMQGIYDLVGEKMGQIFDAQSISIDIIDHETSLFSTPYLFEKGERYYPEPAQITTLLANIIANPRTVYIEDALAEADEFNLKATPGTQLAKSGVFVPLMIGNEVRGVVSIQNIDRAHAFSDGDIRLLTTLANSMSVALESARLFDETQRLLKETEERNAELAVINSVQEGLVSELDFQGIIDLVGDRLRGILNTDSIGIRIYDPESDLIHFHYSFEQGKRLVLDPVPLSSAILSKYIIENKQTIRGSSNALAEKLELRVIPGTEESKALMSVPILLGDQALGLIVIDNFKSEDAFTESDQRLLETLSASLSVALENARLFEETQRLLGETEQRAQELAIINSVQEGLASKLEIQAIYELVGDKIQKMFGAQTVIIGTFDHKNLVSQLEYVFEDGERFIDDELLPFSQMNKHLIKTRQPVVINEDSTEVQEEYGLKLVEGTKIPKSLIFVPFGTSQQVNGYFSVTTKP